jgi:hypothetical protein
MVPFNLQIELNARLVTFSAEQLDQLADKLGFMRYQIRTFNHSSVVFVYTGAGLPESGDPTGFSEEAVFSAEEVIVMATGIREYNNSRKLNFDQLHFDF